MGIKNQVEENIEHLVYWINERQRIYLKRQRGDPKPWTKDLILQQYRFCNAYREQDKVTKWIAKHWRTPNDKDPDLWFAMLVARYINEPASLELVGYPVPWTDKAQKRFHDAVVTRKAIGKNFYNPAYIISTGGQAIPKHQYLAGFFSKFWKDRFYMRPNKDQNLAIYADRLVAVPGMGTFFAGQIIADLKYTSHLKNSPDWWTFAVSGPGSRRGLNRVLGRPVEQNWREADWKTELDKLRKIVNEKITMHGLAKLHGQDLQNCLCEFSKFMKAVDNVGKPKQRYPGV